MSTIKLLLFDVDGVITDGKKYTDGKKQEWKSMAMKDLDALRLFKESGYKLGCITGEDTIFSRQFLDMQDLDFVRIGCKQKEAAFREAEETCHMTSEEVCYIGDGKYDIPALERAGCAVCPKDAIEEVKEVSDIVLQRKGGEGCLAELYTLLVKKSKKKMVYGQLSHMDSVILNRIAEHQDILGRMSGDSRYISEIVMASRLIIESYRNGGHLFLCGNGGSAADAQHLAAELVGRFYLERKALSAEAFTVNTSILTALANDYDYDMIFARQLEAKAVRGDVLIGITTSGTSENILQAFEKAQEMDVKTILMTGNISEYTPIRRYTDCLLAVPSGNTPRIQEAHILLGHILCEMVEQELAG